MNFQVNHFQLTPFLLGQMFHFVHEGHMIQGRHHNHDDGETNLLELYQLRIQLHQTLCTPCGSLRPMSQCLNSF